MARKLILALVLSAAGMLVGGILGSVFAWWVVHPHDIFAGGGYAAMAGFAVGGAVGVLAALFYCCLKSSQRRLERSQAAYLMGFLFALLWLVPAVVLILFWTLLGVPLRWFWEAFLPGL